LQRAGSGGFPAVEGWHFQDARADALLVDRRSADSAKLSSASRREKKKPAVAQRENNPLFPRKT